MNTICRLCSTAFEITDEDLAFFEKISPIFPSTSLGAGNGKRYDVPPPTLCPGCREQNRFSYRNESHLYHRKCDKSGKQMISLYSSDKPYKVYEQSVWWSDQFDPLEYGRDFDFKRSFFEQWHELSLVVPRLSIHNAKSENCEYTNYSAENKNCYMVVGGLGCEDNYYSYRPSYCKNICDCYDPYECELCYEVSESKKLYDCQYCVNCHNSRGLVCCSSCTGCEDCFGCVNLRGKKYHIFNKPYEESEYRQKLLDCRRHMDVARRQYEAFKLTQPHRALDMIGCEDSTGEHVLNCKNCHDVFIYKNSQDCRYGSFCEGNVSCVDTNFCDNCQFQYHSGNLEKNHSVLFTNLAWYVSDAMYCTSCFNSSSLFGCVGMKKHKYCILNKQYTKEAYEELVPKIIEKMRADGEWGEYFPTPMSPFGYNETVANEYYPVTKDEAAKRQWQWHDEEMQRDQYLGPDYNVPADIKEVSDEIMKQILKCEVTKKPYKIIPQELQFYRQMGIPIPRKCPDQRHAERMALRNPRKLWSRQCAKCKEAIETTYAPERPEVVYCEECYLKEVY